MNDPTAIFSRTLQTMSSSLERLHPDPRNPRIHSPRQIKQIAKSIQAFGFNVPILVDRGGKILAGHGRYLAAQQLGLAQVPVIQLEHLSPEQARAFAIADNKLTENASWNDILLGEIFADLASLDLSFDLEVTGFSMGEIDLRIEGLEGGAASPDAAETVELPDPAQTAITQPGDLWELDGHRILCANALEAAAYEQLLGGRQADVIFSDPPFNVPIDHHVTGNGKTQHREFAMASGEMSSAEFTQFLRSAMALLAAHSRNGSIHFICMDWRHLPEILTAGSQVYTELKNLCVWVKDKGGMGSFYRSQHELVLVYKNGSAAYRNNIELGQHGRYRTNVWNYPGANTLSRQGTEGNLLAMHPTVKPIALVTDAILDCSARGDLVLDAFLGSGTTLLAAHRVGRICFGLEIDPLYVDTAIRRWQAMTGQSARLSRTGQSFDELQALAASVMNTTQENQHG
jgi:DNA modification methylase